MGANILGFSWHTTSLPKYTIVGGSLSVLCAGDVDFSSAQRLRGASLWPSRFSLPLPIPPALCPAKSQRILTPPSWIQSVGDQPEVEGWKDGKVRSVILLLPSLPDQQHLHYWEVTAVVKDTLHTAVWVPVTAPLSSSGLRGWHPTIISHGVLQQPQQFLYTLPTPLQIIPLLNSLWITLAHTTCILIRISLAMSNRNPKITIVYTE